MAKKESDWVAHLLDVAKVTRPNCLASWLDDLADHLNVAAEERGDRLPAEMPRDEFLPRAAEKMLDLCRISGAFVPLYPDPLASRAGRLLGHTAAGLTPIAQGEVGRLELAFGMSVDLYQRQQQALKQLRDEVVSSLRELADDLRGHDLAHGMPQPPAALARKGKRSTAAIVAAIERSQEAVRVHGVGVFHPTRTAGATETPAPPREEERSVPMTLAQVRQLFGYTSDNGIKGQAKRIGLKREARGSWTFRLSALTSEQRRDYQESFDHGLYRVGKRL